MNFDLTAEQKDIITAAREFAEKLFPDIAQECDREEKSPKHLWQKACELGFVGVFIPEAYGGAGLGFLEHCLINEEFWRVDAGIAHFILAGTFGSELILLFGTEEQKKKWVPPLVKAQAITGAAITEPDAGSDVSSIRTTAVLDGNEYVINGSKMFITGGTIADYLLVLCVTEPHAKSRHDRLSVILVETDRKGYEANKLKDKLGLRASDTAEISFSDVRVPQENLVGTAGKGFQQFMVFFDHTRLHVCAEAVGLAQGAMEQAVKHVRKREQFGKPLASFQVTQFKIAEMATRMHKQLSPLTIKVLGGITIGEDQPPPSPGKAPPPATDRGGKGVLEAWWNMTDQAWTSLDASLGTTDWDIGSRIRVGWRFWPELSVGIEGGSGGTLAPTFEFDASRVGAFVRYEWATGEISISGGVAFYETKPEWEGAPGPFGTVSVLTRF